jgi:hypothetical protein
MMYAGHPIEGVGKQPRPLLDRRPRLFESRCRVSDRYDDARLPQDLRRLGEVCQLRRHRDLTQCAVGRTKQPLNQVGIRIAKQGRIVRSAVLAGEKWTLKVDPQDRRISASLGRRDVNLGNQNIG